MVRPPVPKYTWRLIVVTPLAFTRAAVDPAYTKLDLMNKEAVEGFFQTHKVKGTHPWVESELMI